MNQPHVLVKVAVVASSLLLGGGFVLYKGGALDGMIGSGVVRQGAAAAGVGGELVDTPGVGSRSDSGSARKDTLRERYWYGSKSEAPMIEFKPGDTPDAGSGVDPGPAQPDTVERRERHMGGSKSLAPMIELPEPDSQETGAPDGSKRQKKDR